MKRYDITITLRQGDIFDVDLLADHFANGARPFKTFTGWSDCSNALRDLGIDIATINAMVPNFAMEKPAVVHDAELEAAAVERFNKIGL